MSFDPTIPPEPLTPGEIAAYKAAAAHGETPSLEIVRRYIFTTRKSLLASPKKAEKAKKGRTKKTETTEAEVEDFF